MVELGVARAIREAVSTFLVFLRVLVLVTTHLSALRLREEQVESHRQLHLFFQEVFDV